MPNTVRLKDYAHVKEEYAAAGAITPGMFLLMASATTVNVAGADHDGVNMVAVEDEFQGKGIVDAYATNDVVQVWVPQPGDIVYAIAGAAIAVNADVSVAAGGKVATTVAGPIIGEALDAAAADNDRIRIRIK